MARSGSTWLYNALRLISERMLPGSTYACWVEDFKLEEAHGAANVVVKVHSPDELLRPVAWRIFTSGRDLRDIAASALDIGFTDAGNLMDFLTANVQAHRFWGTRAQLDVAYDDIVGAPEALLARLGELLEVRLDGTQITELRWILGHFRQPPKGSGYDKKTLMHPQHCSDGRVGAWRERLDPVLAREIECRLGDELRRFAGRADEGIKQKDIG